MFCFGSKCVNKTMTSVMKGGWTDYTHLYACQFGDSVGNLLVVESHSGAMEDIWRV